jgi:outer membrane protein assembly factor BamD (BamD/ComL family)
MRRRNAKLLAGALALVLCLPAAAQAANRRGQDGEVRTRLTREDFQANRLFKQAQDYIEAGQDARGVKMMETIIDQFPLSFVKFKAYLALGRHYLDERNSKKALWPLQQLKQLEQLTGEDEELTGDALDIYLEGMYLTGVAYYQGRQYDAAFPVLRRITRTHPNTVWANQSYYYIGMSHFAQENWKKAIEALSLVGTFVGESDEDGSMRFIEAGSRFYVKIEDDDLPVLHRLGREIRVEIRSDSGDREEVVCIPLNRSGDIFIGSIPTEIDSFSEDKMDDEVLQVLGGDEISTRYIDQNTFAGERNVERASRATVISSGRVTFTLATHKENTDRAYLDGDVYLKVHDADLDRTDEADQVNVKLVSRYIDEEEHDEQLSSVRGIDIDALLNDEGPRERWKVRDSVEIVLTETELEEEDPDGERSGNADTPAETDAENQPIRSGVFIGSKKITKLMSGREADPGDDILNAKVGDQIQVQYVDALHIKGRDDKTLTAEVNVVGEFDADLEVSNDVVENAVDLAKKNLVEAEAYLELGRIFSDMGLKKRGGVKCDDAIRRLDEVIEIEAPLPTDKRQRAYQLKWQAQMVKGDLGKAMQTCQDFNETYPQSPMVDDALKEMGRIHMEKKNYDLAESVFRHILDLKNSQVKDEAQFHLAEVTEKTALEAALENNEENPELAALSAAVPEYRKCAEEFPESEFAGPALSRLVDYYIKTKDFMTATEMLKNVFDEHPDADFLDQMLLKWTLVAYQMGDKELAMEKCTELLFNYPDSKFAPQAKGIRQKLEKMLGTSSGGGSGDA